MKNAEFEVTATYIQHIFGKILTYLEDQDNSRGSDHKLKVEICRFLKLAGLVIYRKIKQFLGVNLEFVMRQLEILVRDRVLEVQTEAKSAQKVWRKLEEHLINLDR